MIIGGSKTKVIKNIEKNILNNELNKKAELGDPKLTDEEMNTLLSNYEKKKSHKILFGIKNVVANIITNTIAVALNSDMKFVGLDNLNDIKSGAIITSNHFNPLDTLLIRKLINKKFHKNIYIVSQTTNLAMEGFIGYLMNYINVIPICDSPRYIINKFGPLIEKNLKKKNFILIYPEEEMWFNYRKPRPCKRGAYKYAALNNVPIISCFTEMIDTNKSDNDEFVKVKYIVHVLKPIYPDKNKSAKENSIDMALIDYNQKKECYEKVYHKKLDYKFDISDIAGFKKEIN